jgi:MoaA/NifB/PqqE/SkfB family radical SAM enzyme
VDSLDLVKNNIEQASMIKKRGGNWALTTTITELATLDEIKALESFAAQNGFMYAIRPYVHTLGNAGKNDDILSIKDTSRIIEIFEYMRGRAEKNNYFAALMYTEHIRFIRNEPQPLCDALRRSMVMSPAGHFAPCIEFTGESSPLEEMRQKKKYWLSRCENCNRETPCFYNDVREIGIIWRNKWKIAFAFPKIISQMAKYGNFF